MFQVLSRTDERRINVFDEEKRLLEIVNDKQYPTYNRKTNARAKRRNKKVRRQKTDCLNEYLLDSKEENEKLIDDL